MSSGKALIILYLYVCTLLYTILLFGIPYTVAVFMEARELRSIAYTCDENIDGACANVIKAYEVVCIINLVTDLAGDAEPYKEAE